MTVLFLPNIESNIYSLQIKELLTQEVCSNGIFILDAELNIPIKDTVISEDVARQIQDSGINIVDVKVEDKKVRIRN